MSINTRIRIQKDIDECKRKMRWVMMMDKLDAYAYWYRELCVLEVKKIRMHKREARHE